MVATILFTDIVGSTRSPSGLATLPGASSSGRHYRDVRDELDRVPRPRDQHDRRRFPSPSSDGAGWAIQAAIAIGDRARSLDLDIRAGIDVGEVEAVGGDVRGVAVHEAARIAGAAAGGEIRIPETTWQLASASWLAFEALGVRELKGLTGARSLYVVVAAPAKGRSDSVD